MISFLRKWVHDVLVLYQVAHVSFFRGETNDL
jgi:hypothetical protein